MFNRLSFKILSWFLERASEQELQHIIRAGYDTLFKEKDRACRPETPSGAIENEFGTSFDLRNRCTCDSVLKIFENDRVLDVGGGHNPLERADVVVDVDSEESPHRNGNRLKLFPHQQFVCASVESLPFADNEFDYVFCSQVLEHVENPALACAELQRVAKKGFIDTPRSCCDLVFSHKQHRWLIDRIDNILFFRPKPVMMEHSVLFKHWGVLAWQLDPEVQERVESLYRNVSNNSFEWEEAFEYKVVSL